MLLKNSRQILLSFNPNGDPIRFFNFLVIPSRRDCIRDSLLALFKKSVDPIVVGKAEVGNVDLEIHCNIFTVNSDSRDHH